MSIFVCFRIKTDQPLSQTLHRGIYIIVPRVLGLETFLAPKVNMVSHKYRRKINTETQSRAG